MEDILTKHYGLQPERSFKDGRAERYMADGSIYTIVNVTNREQDNLAELYNISEHMKKYGDRYVSSFVPTAEGRFLVNEKEQDYTVLKNNPHSRNAEEKIGRKLAKFHHRGRAIEEKITHISRIGQWKTLWEKRIEQMEKAYQMVIENHPVDEFERMFIDSCPYYIGLAENAVQYLVDTEMDDNPVYTDSGTVCHERFSEGVWGREITIRNPFDWVFDHGGRDIAEHVRERYFKRQNTHQPDIQQFLRDYQSVEPLSSFSWRIVFARLLFPLHYFETVENYYLSESEGQQFQMGEKLHGYLNSTRHYEQFLGNFYGVGEVPVKSYGIPVVTWLR
ncbi:spore coat putative kinase YutH [Bacillus sp. SG-1]|uniref:spore coat putative kinase YutH n=1 Tax=Bacillus sp. SG-1 TaxID=161544 RepID=UPI0001544E60|nr:spore coat protein YutH [Bacillus sp. SG-1]EDL63414.1 CotS-related protein [Bacillus sp. SG-1]